MQSPPTWSAKDTSHIHICHIISSRIISSSRPHVCLLCFSPHHSPVNSHVSVFFYFPITRSCPLLFLTSAASAALLLASSGDDASACAESDDWPPSVRPGPPTLVAVFFFGRGAVLGPGAGAEPTVRPGEEKLSGSEVLPQILPIVSLISVGGSCTEASFWYLPFLAVRFRLRRAAFLRLFVFD